MPMAASHFTMVGFEGTLENQAGMVQFIQRHAAACTPTPLTPTDLVCLVRDPSGGELRLAFSKGPDGGPKFQTMNPAFDGEGRTEIEVVADQSDPEWKTFEVTIAARFAGQEAPLVVDLADPAQAVRLRPGAKAAVEIAAFSFEPKVYADEAAFLASQGGEAVKVRLAPNYFIPSGLFFQKVGGAMPDDAERPVAYADFAGKIVKAELRTNAAGSGRFWWLLVDTFDTKVDVVIDPTTVAAEPKPGEIVTGRFWLSARLATADAGAAASPAP